MKTIVLDIGGTAIKSAICEDGVLSEVRETPTKAALGGLHVMTRAKAIICDYQKEFSFERIGISTAGLVNPENGSIIYSNQNIPGYTGTRIKDILEEYFHLPVSVQNDANSAAIGEAVFGAGRDETSFACLSYGTGVGGAMFIDGKLYYGSNYSAGEFGAIITHPGDRDPSKDFFSGCYEKYASNAALLRAAAVFDKSIRSGRHLFQRLDDPDIRRIVDNWIMEVVYGLTSIVHTLSPACIILGGGVMEQPYALEQVRTKLSENIMPSFRHVRIKQAELGSQAGLLGASVLHLI